MAISATLLTSGTSTTDGSSFTTASITPAASSLLLVFVTNAVTGGADATLSGLSATWTRPVNQAASSSTKLSVHWAQLGASPGSGALSISTSVATGSIVWHVVQVTGHNTAAPVVQTPAATGASSTAASLTYAAAGNAANRLLYACGVAGSATQTPRTNWAELADLTVATPSCSLETQWRSDATETTGSSTLSVANLWATAGVEIAAAATTTPVSGDLDLRWRSYTSVAASVDLRWRSSVLVSSDLDARWRSYAAVSSDLDARWRVSVRVTSDLDARWRVSAAVTSDADLRWRVLSSLTQVSSATDLRWLSLAAVSAGVDLRWRVLPGAAVTRPDAGTTVRAASGIETRPYSG
ncbi:MAG TPA: hypothetical protein VIQ79_30210, partial [Kribbella sp.]